MTRGARVLLAVGVRAVTAGAARASPATFRNTPRSRALSGAEATNPCGR